MDVIEEEDLCTRTNELGSHLKKRLEPILARIPEIVDFRGPGLLDATKFNTADGSAPNLKNGQLRAFRGVDVRIDLADMWRIWERNSLPCTADGSG